MVILAHPLIDLVLDHGSETAAQASVTATTLAMFALGLPGFCTFLYLVRVLQSMQDTRTAFRIYLIENAINIGLAVVLVGPLGVRGLALATSVAYTVAALIGLSVVARKEGGLAADDLTTSITRVLVSTAVMAVATVFAVNVSGATSGPALLARVVLGVVVGVVAFVGTTVLLGVRADRRAGADRPAREDARYAGDGAPPEDVPPADPAMIGDSPRDRAAVTSIRLVTPDTDGGDDAPPDGSASGGDGQDGADGGRDAPAGTRDPGADQPSTLPFRGRLALGPDATPVRRLRPVPDGRGDTPASSAGVGRSTGDPPADEPGAGAPPEHEE
jgi:hypothetical protein